MAKDSEEKRTEAENKLKVAERERDDMERRVSRGGRVQGTMRCSADGTDAEGSGRGEGRDRTHALCEGRHPRRTEDTRDVPARSQEQQ